MTACPSCGQMLEDGELICPSCSKPVLPQLSKRELAELAEEKTQRWLRPLMVGAAIGSLVGILAAMVSLLASAGPPPGEETGLRYRVSWVELTLPVALGMIGGAIGLVVGLKNRLDNSPSSGKRQASGP